MILIDGLGHMVSDESEQELHEFARKLGLKRRWYQDHPKHPHYDLTTERARQRALSLGAEKVKATEILKRAWWSNENWCGG